MAEEGQEAMTVAEIERIIKTTEPREMSSNGDRVWTRRMAEALHGRLAAVERTTANDALRRAAEVALAEKLTGVPPPNWDASDLAIAEGAARATAKSIASAILALIKEPGHE